MDDFAVVCSSGSYRNDPDGSGPVTHFAHRWTDGGVDVATAFTGAHLLHAAIAACVLNDLYREAEKVGLPLDGARVEARGGFREDWSSVGVSYRVEIDSRADASAIEQLIETVDQVAEIPKALRAGARVTRTP